MTRWYQRKGELRIDATRAAACYTFFMLVMDVREACNPKRTGKGQWTLGLVSALLRRQIPLTLVTDRPLPDSLTRLLRPDHDVLRFAFTGWRWHWRVHRFLLTLSRPTYLSTTSYILPALGARTVRFVTVVHDLIAFRPEPHDRRATLIERLTLRRAVRRSWKLCSLSDSTAADLRRFAPESAGKTASVGAGPAEQDAVWQPPGTHIFCLATLCPRKNQRVLIEAYATLPDALRSRFPLLLAGGRGWGDAEIVTAAQATEGVRLLGYVDDVQAAKLLSSSAVFAYPSRYEGFGLPVLDAMRAGVPVLTTTAGSLAEVAGDAAVIADPESVQSIALGLQRLLTDAALRQQCSERGLLRARAFSWERTADLLLTHLEIDNLA